MLASFSFKYLSREEGLAYLVVLLYVFHHNATPVTLHSSRHAATTCEFGSVSLDL